MKKTYLFSFEGFINEQRFNPEKKEHIEDYEKIYGPMPNDFKETDIYKQYVSKFKPLKRFKLIVPDELESDFDWELLEQLAAASFSSDYWLELSEDNTSYQLFLSVKSGGKQVVKKVEELWSFQINRLFEIYINEQINLFALMDDEDESDAVHAEQETKIKKYSLQTAGLTDDDHFFTGLDEKLGEITKL